MCNGTSICDLSSENPAYALLCYLQENMNLYNFAKIVEFHFLTDFKSVMTTLLECLHFCQKSLSL